MTELLHSSLSQVNEVSSDVTPLHHRNVLLQTSVTETLQTADERARDDSRLISGQCVVQGSRCVCMGLFLTACEACVLCV